MNSNKTNNICSWFCCHYILLLFIFVQTESAEKEMRHAKQQHEKQIKEFNKKLEEVKRKYEKEVKIGCSSSIWYFIGNSFRYTVWKDDNTGDLWLTNVPSFQFLNIQTSLSQNSNFAPIQKFNFCTKNCITVAAQHPPWKCTLIVLGSLWCYIVILFLHIHLLLMSKLEFHFFWLVREILLYLHLQLD